MTRAPAIVPSCTAAIPTPPAAPCTSSRSPTVRRACEKSASWAVVKTSGTPPAAVQSSSSGTGIAADSWTTASSAWPPPATTAITRSPGSKRVTPRPTSATSPASSRPGDVLRRAGRRRIAPGELHHVGAVEAGRLHADEQLARLGDGIGVLLDDDRAVADGHGAHGPDPCTALATPADLPVPRSARGFARREWGNTASNGRHAAHAAPALRSPTSRRCGASRASDSSWRELRRSPVFRGHGVPGGEGRAVLLIPGFMAGDGSLATMTHWLRATGYRTRRAGIRANVGCSEEACARLEARAGGLRRARRPEGLDHRPEPWRRVRPRARRPPPRPRRGHRHARLADGLPAADPSARARAGRRSCRRSAARGVPGLFTWRCLRGNCCEDFRDALTGAVPRARSRFVAMYSRTDGDRRLALLPGPSRPELVEVGTSHCGMSVSAQVYRELGVRARRASAARPRHGAAPGPQAAWPSARRARSPGPSSDAGDSTTLPWPGASRAGSSARSARGALERESGGARWPARAAGSA